MIDRKTHFLNISKLNTQDEYLINLSEGSAALICRMHSILVLFEAPIYGGDYVYYKTYSFSSVGIEDLLSDVMCKFI